MDDDVTSIREDQIGLVVGLHTVDEDTENRHNYTVMSHLDIFEVTDNALYIRCVIICLLFSASVFASEDQRSGSLWNFAKRSELLEHYDEWQNGTKTMDRLLPQSCSSSVLAGNDVGRSSRRLHVTMSEDEQRTCLCLQGGGGATAGRGAGADGAGGDHVDRRRDPAALRQQELLLQRGGRQRGSDRHLTHQHPGQFHCTTLRTGPNMDTAQPVLLCSSNCP